MEFAYMRKPETRKTELAVELKLDRWEMEVRAAGPSGNATTHKIKCVGHNQAIDATARETWSFQGVDFNVLTVGREAANRDQKPIATVNVGGADYSLYQLRIITR